MMTHPGEGTLQALLDGELSVEQLGVLEPHIAGCGRCEEGLASLGAARALLSGALPALDVAPRAESALREVKRRTASRATSVPAIALGRAAAIVLVSAAALSATVPGSPVRGWIEDVWRGDPRPAAVPPAPRAGEAEAVAASGAEGMAGVSVLPPAEGMRVALIAPAPGIALAVTFHDGPRLGVWASDDTGGVRFRTGTDRVEIHGATTGELMIEVPRSILQLTIDVGGQVYMLKEGDRILFPGPAADTSGPEIRFRTRR
jgi:hypothetical protein